MGNKKDNNNFWQMMRDITRRGKYIMYGAGVVAYGAFTAIRELYGISPQYFLVTKDDAKIDSYDGIPVFEIRQADAALFQNPLLVAAPEIYHGEIWRTLQKKGVRRAYFLDAHMEYLLMGRYFKEIGIAELLEDLRDDEKKDPLKDPGKMPLPQLTGQNTIYRPDVMERPDSMEKARDILSVYMAKSHRDKKLSGMYEIPEWVVPVQAGRKCTEQAVAELSDAEGDNISGRNPDYCELTVTYWVWKNRSNPYKGICHYRRMLLLDERDIWNIKENDVDMVLPLPYVCYPNAAGQYGRYISKDDRFHLEQAAFEVSPDTVPILRKIDRQPIYYDFNMLIAKERIFDDYAQWMFSILFQAEKYCTGNGKVRSDRYAGYLGELLTTVYIFKNKDKYKIVHGERNWMV